MNGEGMFQYEFDKKCFVTYLGCNVVWGRKNEQDIFWKEFNKNYKPGVPQNVFVVLSFAMFSLHIPKSAAKFQREFYSYFQQL